VRRTVAMSVLRPFAFVDRATGLSGFVGAADDLVGRHGTVGGSVTQLPDPRSVRPVRARDRGRSGPVGATQPASPSETARVGPPPVSQPTASHPLELLEIGDSLGEDLGFGLADVLPSPQVQVLEEAVGDTGLSRPDYYDWPAELQEELSRYHPQAVVVFLGANDAQSFVVDGTVVSFGTPSWQADYSARVGELMSEAAAAGAHVLWVGMPVMASASMSQEMQGLNAIYARQASEHSGVTYFSSWSTFTAPGGGYDEYLPDSSGTESPVRDSDGVHLTASGDDRLAQALVPAMEADWHVNL
ncbi:MAG: SGNH/GDSL hydrolase family protein, partial [Acidimicrobiales bacterium]